MPTSGVPHTRNRHRTSDVGLLVNACLLVGEFHLTQRVWPSASEYLSVVLKHEGQGQRGSLCPLYR